jgi:hypothetical protein
MMMMIASLLVTGLVAAALPQPRSVPLLNAAAKGMTMPLAGMGADHSRD